MVSRREFLKFSAASAGALYMSTYYKFLQRVFAQQDTPLPGSSIPQFIDPLPLLSVAGGPMETIVAGTGEITLTMKEFQSNVMPSAFVPATGTYTGTWVWGYRAGATPDNPAGTYIGPVIVAERTTPTQVKFINNLTTNQIFWTEWTDQSLHWANPDEEPMMVTNPNPPPAMIGNPAHYLGSVPAVPHLHGGEIPPVIDGGPDAWFLQDGSAHGHAFYSMDGNTTGNYAIYRYPNTQEAAMIWFHDHVLGATRLNVYAGLAGAYALIDPGLALPTGLHPIGLGADNNGVPDSPIVPMVLQDRTFDTNGQLYLPNLGINPEHPYWVPEFVGDTIVVNGKVWPFLNVEPRRYRFLFINGSNARTYELFITNPVTKIIGPPMWQIGTDGGYLDAPVKIDPNAPKGQLQKLTIMPGERADVIIDFAGLAGQTLLMRNTGRTPYPKGTAPAGNTLGQIILFRVGPGPVADASYDPTSGIPLRPPMIRLVDPAAGTLAAGVTADRTRQLTLNEIIGPGGPLEILVNNTKWDGKSSDKITFPDGVRTDFSPVSVGGVTEYYSELPNEGDTEVWEIVNLTADAHPIHTHLTQFQLLNRQNFNINKYNGAYNAAFPGGVFVPAYGPPLDYNVGNVRALGGNPDITGYLQGPAMPPNANEAGWKDTVIMFPGQVTRFAVRYAPLDKPINDPDLSYPFDPNANGHGYVWHCHIIDHEDNEMMRPYAVTPKGDVIRDYEQGSDY